MTVEEFEERVSRGESLQILDDMVLDVSRYQYEHPGGKFLVSYLIGSDISKFFYGGYALENFDGKPKAHWHTNIALHQVNSMIIGKLTRRAPEFRA